MDQSTDVTLSVLQFLVANPILLSSGVNLGYLIGGLVLFRLVWAWANRTSATGEDFTIHDSIDKIFKSPDTLGLAVLLGSGAIALAIVFAAFIGG